MNFLSKLKSSGAGAANLSTTWQIDAAAVGLCMLLSAGAYFAAIGPMLSSRDDRSAREASLVETKDQATRMVADARLIRAQLNHAQIALAKIEIPLQSATAVNQRLAELTALAGECGLEVQAVQPGAILSSQRYALLPIQVSGTGTYRTCTKFLHRLGEKFPDTAMRAFELSANPAEPATPASFNFQLSWYVQPSNSAAASAR
jgi:Tfp pilus assembly protein PilO